MQDLIGKIIKRRYKVEKMIGRGGMAEVYKVYDNQRNQHLAMKVLREDLAHDKVFLRRFQREAHTLAKLQHPHIVRFYGLDSDEGTAMMLMMGYVDGITLAELLHRLKRPLTAEEILAVMKPVCSALQFAHKSGFIHRDVKPSNILIDNNGHVWLTDFGLAHMTETATLTMVSAGTPAYMSPEQILAKDPTSKIDIYSLGVVLYELLTGGERPFTGEKAKTSGSTIAERVRWEKLNLTPPPLRLYNKAISKELEAVVMRCLERDPQKRFQDTISLYRLLERALGGKELALKSEKALANLVKSFGLKEKKGNNLVPFVITGAAVLIFAGFLLTRGRSSGLSKLLNLQPINSAASTPSPTATASPRPINTSQPTVTPTPSYFVGDLVYSNDIENKKLSGITLDTYEEGEENTTAGNMYGFLQEKNGNTHLRVTGSGDMTFVRVPNFEEDFRFAFNLRSLFLGDSDYPYIEIIYRISDDESPLPWYNCTCSYKYGGCGLNVENKDLFAELAMGKYTIKNDVWNYIEITVFNNQHWLTINGDLIAKAVDSRNTGAGNHIVIQVPGNAIFDLDNIEIYRLSEK